MSFVVYCITYTDSLTTLKYIGHTSSNKWNTGYCGSVSSQKYKSFWKNALKLNPSNFKRELLSTHQTRNEALQEEYRLHVLYDVVNSEEYANMTCATSTKFTMAGRQHSTETKTKIGNSNRGSKRSDESKLKMSIAAKGKIISDETKAKMSAVRKGVQKSKESNEKRSISLKGRVISDESRNKISLSKTGKPTGPQKRLTCPHCGNVSGASAAKRNHFDNCKTM